MHLIPRDLVARIKGLLRFASDAAPPTVGCAARCGRPVVLDETLLAVERTAIEGIEFTYAHLGCAHHGMAPGAIPAEMDAACLVVWTADQLAGMRPVSAMDNAPQDPVTVVVQSLLEGGVTVEELIAAVAKAGLIPAPTT